MCQVLALVLTNFKGCPSFLVYISSRARDILQVVKPLECSLAIRRIELRRVSGK